jgi:hypothetical protein
MKKRPVFRRLKAYESVALPAELGWRFCMRFMYLAQNGRVVNLFRGRGRGGKWQVFLRVSGDSASRRRRRLREGAGRVSSDRGRVAHFVLETIAE